MQGAATEAAAATASAAEAKTPRGVNSPLETDSSALIFFLLFFLLLSYCILFYFTFFFARPVRMYYACVCLRARV